MSDSVKIARETARKKLEPLARAVGIDTPTSMRERLARALHRFQVGSGHAEPDTPWQSFMDDVDTLLEELREPSEGMTVAGHCVVQQQREIVMADDVWRAMIQHIRDGGS